MSDTATTVAAAPFIKLLQPFVTAAVTTTIGVAVPFAVALLRRWTGVVVSQAALARLQQAAEAEAGKAIAEAADNLARRQIDVHSEIVRSAADAVAERLPDALVAAGLSPDALDHMIAGEIGKLQARMTVAPVDPAPKTIGSG